MLHPKGEQIPICLVHNIKQVDNWTVLLNLHALGHLPDTVLGNNDINI